MLRIAGIVMPELARMAGFGGFAGAGVQVPHFG